MKKKLPVIIALILTIAAAVFFGNTSKAHRIYDNNINKISYADLGTLEDGKTVTQRFVCKENVIDGFKIKAGVAGDHGSTSVHIEVTDVNTGELICTVDEDGAIFKPRKMHYFHTERLSDMKGKELELTLTENGSKPGSGVLFYYAPTDKAEYKINVDDNTLDGVLPMATVTEKFDIETFVIFLLSLWFIWGFMWGLYKLFQ